MIYERGCAEERRRDIVQDMWNTLLIVGAGILIAVVKDVLLGITILDEDGYGERLRKAGKKERFWQGMLCLGNGGVIRFLLLGKIPLQEELAWVIVQTVLLCVFAGGMLSASIMDGKSGMVYNYIWWVTGSTAMILVCLSMCRKVFPVEAFPVLLFGLLQEFGFSRLYGRADCHAFAVCALAGSAYGMQLREFLLHMLLAISLLGLVQMARGNISCKGKLRTAKPFLPYITISFWMLSVIWILFRGWTKWKLPVAF